MKFEKNIEERYTIVKVLDEKIDSLNAPVLKSEIVMLNTEGVRNIVFDLTHVKYIDSSGLSAVLTASRLCGDADGALVLCHLSEYVEKLIKISRLDEVFNILPTQQESIDAIMLDELERELTSESSDDEDEDIA